MDLEIFKKQLVNAKVQREEKKHQSWETLQ